MSFISFFVDIPIKNDNHNKILLNLLKDFIKANFKIDKNGRKTKILKREGFHEIKINDKDNL